MNYLIPQYLKVSLILTFLCTVSAINGSLRATANPFLQDDDTLVLTGEISREESRAVIIVMDASGSMADPAPGAASKMLMAKQVLEQVLTKIDDHVPVGLRVYGSTKSNTFDQSSACKDSVLLVPPGVGNRGQMINRLREVKPTGMTPISYALRMAVNDLKNIEATNKSIVLISDGVETCGHDPCSLVESFANNGINVQFNVVGFGIGEDLQAQMQLKCIANASKGKFYSANTSSELANGILDGVNYQSTTINTVTGEITELK